jgi:hypothetical protein
MAERDARILGKLALYLGLAAGPLLMTAGFGLAILTGRSSVLTDLCFYGGAIAGGLLVFGGTTVLVLVPNRRPAQGIPKAQGINSEHDHAP